MALIHVGHLGTALFGSTLTPGSGTTDDRDFPNPTKLHHWELHGKRRMADVTPWKVTQEVWVPSHVAYAWYFRGFIEHDGGRKPAEFHRNHCTFKLTPDSDEPNNYFEGDGFVEEFKLRGVVGDLMRFEAIVRGSPNQYPLNIAGW